MKSIKIFITLIFLLFVSMNVSSQKVTGRACANILPAIQLNIDNNLATFTVSGSSDVKSIMTIVKHDIPLDTTAIHIPIISLDGDTASYKELPIVEITAEYQ